MENLRLERLTEVSQLVHGKVRTKIHYKLLSVNTGEWDQQLFTVNLNVIRRTYYFYNKKTLK